MFEDIKDFFNETGFAEELTEENFVVPNEEDYIDFGEETEEWDIAEGKPGLWENIRKKKQREGKKYRPAKPGDKDRPKPDAYKRAQKSGKKVDEAGYDDKKKKKKEAKADVRKTPAPKKDQKKGSKKNKPDSAKDPSGKIKFSKEVTAQLSKKVKDHNASNKGSKASLGALKAVYRRGAGAYSTSHAPKMSRHGWAIARVNAFLYLLRNGRPKNSGYKQDNDLLPKGHPKKSSAGMKKKYSMGDGSEDVFDNPGDAMKRAKQLGLDKIHKHEGEDGKTIYMPGASHEEYMKTVTTKGPHHYKKGYGGHKGGYKYQDPRTGEIYTFKRKGTYRKNGRVLVPVLASAAHNAGPMEDYVFTSEEEAMKMAKKIGMDGVHKSITGDGKTLYIPGKTEDEFKQWYRKHKGEDSKGAEYQGRKVTLNKPFRTPDGPKKMSVYVKNEKGNVVKVNFGDPNMKIKKNIPERRKSFRARHNCDNPGPKWKARYWSCKAW
mgnify:CR=1 FL=1